MLTCQKILKQSYYFSMQILVIIVGFLAIKSRYSFHFLFLSFMLVQLQRILMQFRYILWQHPFAQRLLSEIYELFFNFGKRNIGDFLNEKRVGLQKHFIWIIFQLQTLISRNKQIMLGKSTAFIVLVLISTISSACITSNDGVIDGINLIYTTAKLLDETEQEIVLQLYKNLTMIKDYNIGLEYKIFTNIYPICNKNDSSIQTINSKNDVWLCFDQFYVVSCNELWEITIKCGTFVEIHRPFDSNILAQLNLQAVSWIIDENGQKIINMALISLCAGTYHIWLVYYSRMGKFIKGVKAIYITYPNCIC